VRDGDKRIVRLKEGEPRGRHVVIVDDLVQSGGTLIECQKLLTSQVGRHWHTHPSTLLTAPIILLCSCRHHLDRFRMQSTCCPLCHAEQALTSLPCSLQGAAHVSVYVTHGVFPNQTWERFTAPSNGTGDGFNFWITDSCATTAAALANQAPYEILSLADPIAAALQI